MLLAQSNPLLHTFISLRFSLIILCLALCLPLLSFIFVLLYLSAWHTYYQLAQTDTEFNLPYDPRKVLKLNLLKLGMIISWVEYMPKILSFLYWRYWKYGPDQFGKIVRCDITYYGSSTLDVYYPTRKKGTLSKIILFVYGGGWGSGSKFLYMTLANTLRELGYVVVVPDYRKYPEVKIDEIYKDIRESIRWTFKHAKEDLKGDHEQVYIMGHSAGGHLTAQIIISDILEQIQPVKRSSDDFLPRIAGLILMAGVYDISSHLLFEKKRGVEKISAMARVMGSSEEGYRANSPIRIVEKHATSFFSEKLMESWPRILFLHGDVDETVGVAQSIDMFNTLKDAFSPERLKHMDLRLRVCQNMGHGDPVTSLMLNIFYTPSIQKLLLDDIEDFINTPKCT